MCDLLVVTQLTEKLNFNYAEALGTGKGHVALGPAGTGKTETAKDFAKKLGRQMVVICCSDEDKLIGTIKNTFEAARHGSVWMCLDEFNRIPKENLNSLLKHFASDHLPKCAPGRFIT
jgi:dynein heavy chain